MGEHVDQNDIRPSPIAGTWYPGQPQVLHKTIEGWLQEARTESPRGHLIGMVVPHAGHRYSGRVAAYAFTHLMGLHPELVAVISPLHSPIPGRIASTAHRAYSTPLGAIEVDQSTLQQLEDMLQKAGDLKIARVAHDREHSLEIELPFLQVALEQPFKLLPLMLRDQSEATARSVGAALAETLRSRAALIVASSDLSHFYPQDVAERLDGEMLRRIEAFDPQSVLDAEEQGVGFACGRGAIAATLWSTKALGADRIQVVGYATSGDVTQEYESVVGYGAALILRSEKL